MKVSDPDLVVDRIKENNTFLDLLIEIEDFLDGLDMYAFDNWIEGEVVNGPEITRYWVTIALKYPYSMMPDPKGAKRLLDKDIRVKYKEDYELKPVLVIDSSDYQDGTRKPKMRRNKVWFVELQIPRRFIDDISDEWLSKYEDEVEVEDIEQASEEGLEGEGQLKNTSLLGDK